MEKVAMKIPIGLSTAISSRIKNLKRWINDNRFEFLILLVILIIGAVLRLYRISDYMTFRGDEGRDVLIVRRLLVNGDLIFVGPGTSVGNMYLGPLYYYLIAPALLLANFNPVGPSIMVAVVGVATIAFVWYVSNKWFGKTAAIFSSLLYSVSPVVIIYSRQSWNPNIMPFFALLVIFCLWKIWYENNWNWVWVLGFSYAVVLQSHYLGFILLPVIVFFWALSLIQVWGDSKLKKKAIKYSFFAIIIFLLLMSPLFLFDAKHNWRNFGAMKTFFAERQGAVSFDLGNLVTNIWPLIENINTRLLTGTNILVGKTTSVFLILFILLKLFWLIKDKLKTKRNKAYFMVFIWLVFALLGLSLYTQQIYDHYMGFLFPLPFFLIGAFAQEITERIKTVRVAGVVLVLSLLVLVNIQENPLKYPPNKQMQRSMDVAKKIVEESNGERYNFAVISEHNYEGAYQYFLEWWNTPIVIIDPQIPDETITDKLFVVCEYEDKDKCQPPSNPKAEVANFGWSKIDKRWDLDGVILFRLVHNR